MSDRIGVLGSGDVGKALTKGFIKHGYEVMIGTNTDSKHSELKKNLPGEARVGTLAETAAFGDRVVLAVRGTGAEETLRLAGLDNLAGKTIMDTTNPIADQPPANGVLAYFTEPNHSLMERLQARAPEAQFVKVFSCVGSPFMVDPDFGGVKPTMFICGNEADAKAGVVEILEKFGWEYEDMGGIEAARAIEPLAMLWCIPGFRENRWGHAFKLLKLA